ncbi:MAG: response regulator [Planctomycetota bacterium]
MSAPSRILLVDDVPSNLFLLEKLLQSPHRELIRANSGEEALVELERYDFAVVLLDIQMPGMDGFEVAERMREMEGHRDVPIIFITGNENEEFRFRGYEAGAVDYLRKPFQLEILRSKIRVFCEMYENRRVIERQLDEVRHHKERLEAEIRERERAEVDLARSDALFKNFMARVPAATSIKDADGRYVYVNEGFCAAFGTTQLQCTGKTDRELWPPVVADRIRSKDADVLASGGESEVEEELPGAEGARPWLAVRFALNTRSGDDDVLGTIALDLSERRRLEQQLASAQRVEALGQLAGGIAHEINTPTQYVSDNTQFLRSVFEDLGEALARIHALAEGAGDPAERLAQIAEAVQDGDLVQLLEEAPHALHQSGEGLNHIGEMIRAMREFSLPTSMDRSPTDVNQAIRTTATIARAEWGNVASLELDLAPELPLVPCFAGDFNQVVLNLLLNASHAVAEAIGDEREQKGAITISTRADDTHVEIRIADTGAGIPRHVRHRVFEPFFTTKALGLGTGQGLPLVHSVVTSAHGGTVDFETEEGHGTTFRIRLPLVVPSSRAA